MFQQTGSKNKACRTDTIVTTIAEITAMTHMDDQVHHYPCSATLYVVSLYSNTLNIHIWFGSGAPDHLFEVNDFIIPPYQAFLPLAKWWDST